MAILKRTKIIDLLNSNDFGSNINLKGWVRTKRSSKNVVFINLNDGSTINNIQVVVDLTDIDEMKLDCIHTGAAISVNGKLTKSLGSGQKIEVNAKEIEVLGEADPEKYPLQPKRHSLEFLRQIGHLRFRTNTFGAISRVRHSLIFATHNFFNQKGFVNIHSPIITSSDCEGAGEMFRVTTLKPNNAPLKEDGNVDFKQDFFGKETNLTVSGQLEAELAALALTEVYTFGPTFRADNSNTSRHLAEFWMIEPEVAFADLDNNIDLAEEFLKYLIKYSLDHCRDDLLFLNKRLIDEEKNKKQEDRSAMELIEKLQFVLENDFKRVSYTEAFEILKNSKPNKKKRFTYPVDEWGIDLQSEHERFLVEKHFKRPVVVTDYPREIKAFYMRQNDDSKTVRAMDILFPEIGEIVGGSQREERYDRLLKRMKEMNIPEKEMWWYLETRKFGTVPHSGFGLGFDRLVLFVTGMGNIRDVVPFPRTPQNAEF